MVLGIISICVNLLTAAALAYIGSKVRRIENLEATLGAKNEALIEAKFEAAAAGCQLKHVSVGEEFRRIEQRLEKGSNAFHGMDEKAVTARVALVQAVADLRDYVRDNSATKGEMAAISEQIREMQKQVSALAGRFEGMQQAMARSRVES